VRMQKSHLPSAVDRRHSTLLSDAVPGVVPVTTSDIGSVDGACGPVAEDIGDAVAGADAAVQAVRRWQGSLDGQRCVQADRSNRELDMTKTIEQEILAALVGADSWLASYQLSRRVERRRKADGRRSRFLFWWIDSLVPFGTVHRALDGLVREGRVVREQCRPGGAAGYRYRLATEP
jgi:hypothetical protein